MADCIRQLCGLSVFCGIALTLAPEGSTRRMLSFACAVVLLACVLSGLRNLDTDAYALELAQIREREQRFLQHSEDVRTELDRRVIEERCRTYIWDKARELGLTLTDVRVSVQWSLEGVWVPYAAVLDGTLSETDRKRLGEKIETELGIPAERQEWNTYE